MFKHRESSQDYSSDVTQLFVRVDSSIVSLKNAFAELRNAIAGLQRLVIELILENACYFPKSVHMEKNTHRPRTINHYL